MELLYIWVEDWGPFKKANINFGGEYIFSYNQDDSILNCKVNFSYIKNFFNENPRKKTEILACITNVTAIVGENGAGKTMLLDFIKKNLACFWGTKSIIIGKISNEKIIAFHSFGRNKAIKCDNDIIEIKPFPENKNESFANGFLKKQTGVKTLFDDTDCIFFSNIADFRNEVEEYNLINISTNHLLISDKKLEYEKGFCSQTDSEIAIHCERDFEREIEFIHDYYQNKNLLPFKLPNEIIIKSRIDYFDKKSEIVNILKNKVGEDAEIFKFIKEMIAELNKIPSSNINPFMTTPLKKLQSVVPCNIFLHVFYELCKSYNIPDPDFWEKLKKLKANDLRKNGFNIGGLLKRLRKLNLTDENYKKWISGAHIFVAKLGKIVSNAERENNDTEIILSYNKFMPLIKDYRSSYLLDGNLIFKWRDMSSGEKALLNIFSRFHSLSDSQEKSINKKLKKDLIILIDEGELYLHPRWQQRFLKILLDFLITDYAYKVQGVKRNIQIILTTNQPIIASDLPKNNIVFINSSNKIIESQKRDETFGANIHNLLADSFFLDKNYIGSFAKLKIDKLIEIITNVERVNEENIKIAEKLINMIGEPIVKNKLIQMLEDKLSNNIQK